MRALYCSSRRAKVEIVPRGNLTICVLTSSFPSHPRDHAGQRPFLPPLIEALQSHGVRTVVYTQDRPGDKEPVVDAPIAWFPWSCPDRALAQLKPYVPAHLWSMARLGWSGRQSIVPWLQQQQVDLCLAAWAVCPVATLLTMQKKSWAFLSRVWALGSDIYGWAQYPLLRTLIRHILQHADGLFADGIDLSHRVHKLAGRPCTFLPSVRPLTEDVPATAVEVDPTQTNFLFVGRWEKIKGIDVLIEAMSSCGTLGLPRISTLLEKGL